MPRWSDAYRLGLPDVDREHCGLFAALSDLSVAVVSEDWSAARRILEVIPRDAVGHFRREERLMRRAGYAGREWHARQHATARRRAAALIEAALSGGMPYCAAVLSYFRTWLPMHIALHDRMMAASVRNFRRSDPSGTRRLKWNGAAGTGLRPGGRRILRIRGPHSA